MKKSKVIVGMSGGVDSSVAALKLKQMGYEVQGLFMRNWDSLTNNDILGNSDINAIVCPQEQDYQDAKIVAEQLNITLNRIDFINEYWDYVFSYFLAEYKKGRTPNPDILCNKYIKFDYFVNYALNKLNGDYIAMGHYAGVKFNEQLNEYQLYRDINNKKDQTYFLSQLNQTQLSKTIFPLANMSKVEVRKLAEQNNLSTALKKDSTGICFIGERKFKDFLQNYLPAQNGNIINIENDKIIGHHQGIMYYTIGQRKGLNLGGMQERFFVVGKDSKNKILYVAGTNENKWLLSTSCIVANINWISKIVPNGWINVSAKFRYRQKDNEVKIKFINSSTIEVKFNQPISRITPGQAAVFYQNEICLGGGEIDEVFKDDKKIWYL